MNHNNSKIEKFMINNGIKIGEYEKRSKKKDKNMYFLRKPAKNRKLENRDKNKQNLIHGIFGLWNQETKEEKQNLLESDTYACLVNIFDCQPTFEALFIKVFLYCRLCYNFLLLFFLKIHLVEQREIIKCCERKNDMIPTKIHQNSIVTFVVSYNIAKRWRGDFKCKKIV